MVNVGGPSKGCLTCIQRKIRCDRQRPVCGQCQKSKRQCGGYRSTTDIMFRDQSQIVFNKELAIPHGQAMISEQASRNLQDSNTPDSTVTRHMTRSESDTPVMVRSPKINEEIGLINFFANNFTCSNSNRGSNLFWVPSNFDDLLKDDCARFSVQSVGAMALARLQRSAYHHREAQKNYGQAILSLTEFWQQHTETDAVRDAVLVTVMFLGFFEILASYDPSSRQSWMTHLGGLGLLLNNRKEQRQFMSSEFGAGMLLQSRSQAIMNALQTKTPVAEAFRNPAQRVPWSMTPRMVRSDIADMLMIRLATLQAQYQVSGCSNALTSELITLDGDLCQWTKNLPSSWTFSTQLCEEPSELWWEARCDVYSAAVIAHVWNKVRAARIVIHDLIQEASLRLSSNDENSLKFVLQQTDYGTLNPKVRDLIIDICATVPIYYRPSNVTGRFDLTGSLPLLGTTYWLLWPLDIIGSTKEAPPRLTEWVVQCLERIYELTGNVKAQLVAHKLRVKQCGAVMP